MNQEETGLRFDNKGRQVGVPRIIRDVSAPATPTRTTRAPLHSSSLLSHPVRRSILKVFDEDRERRASAKDLLDHFAFKGTDDGAELDLSNVSYHLRVLEDQGIVETAELIKKRGATKRVMALTSKGEAFLNGDGAHVKADHVLDQMADAVRRSASNRDAAYSRLVDLLAATGRDLSHAAARGTSGWLEPGSVEWPARKAIAAQLLAAKALLDECSSTLGDLEVI